MTRWVWVGSTRVTNRCILGPVKPTDACHTRVRANFDPLSQLKEANQGVLTLDSRVPKAPSPVAKWKP